MAKVTTYTIWIQEAGGRGTTHVSSHRARSPEAAANQALRETASDWGGRECGYTAGDLEVLGIAEGDVKIIEWND